MNLTRNKLKKLMKQKNQTRKRVKKTKSKSRNQKKQKRNTARRKRKLNLRKNSLKKRKGGAELDDIERGRIAKESVAPEPGPLQPAYVKETLPELHEGKPSAELCAKMHPDVRRQAGCVEPAAAPEPASGDAGYFEYTHQPWIEPVYATPREEGYEEEDPVQAPAEAPADVATEPAVAERNTRERAKDREARRLERQKKRAEASVEEAPVEEAPVEEAPVEQAPVEEAPVEEAPVEEAPVEEADESKTGTFVTTPGDSGSMVVKGEGPESDQLREAINRAANPNEGIKFPSDEEEEEKVLYESPGEIIQEQLYDATGPNSPQAEAPAEAPAQAPAQAQQEQAPQEQAPQEQAPQEQAPQEQAPPAQAQQEQAPPAQAPPAQAPQEQAPQEQAPPAQAPQEQAPQEQAPQEQVPWKESRTDEAPAQAPAEAPKQEPNKKPGMKTITIRIDVPDCNHVDVRDGTGTTPEDNLNINFVENHPSQNK